MFNIAFQAVGRRFARTATVAATATVSAVAATTLASKKANTTTSTSSMTNPFTSFKSILPKASAKTAAADHGGLSPESFNKFQLLQIQDISDDTAIYYFALDDEDAYLNLPVASYILAKANSKGEDVVRPYTPITDNIPGALPLVIKRYPDGKMGNVFGNLQPGDWMEFKGPLMKYEYKPNEFKHVSFIAGGSGITPMFQIMEKIINDEEDETTMHLLYGNRTSEDILLRPLFDELADVLGDRFDVTYIIDKPERGWNGPTGYINKELLTKVVGKPQKGNKVFVCGPPGMVEAIAGPKGPNYTQGDVKGMLGELGFKNDDVFKF